MKKTIILVIITFLLVFSTNAQKLFFKKNDIIKDIDTMVFLLNDIHPNIFSECPEKEFREEIEKVKKAIPDSTDIFGVYKLIEPIVVLLGDGHTQLNFPRNHFTGEEAFFPLSVIVNTNDSTISTTSAYTTTDITIPTGVKILSINEIPYKNIVCEMLKYHSGERIFFRLKKAAINFSDMFYILHPSEKFCIEYSHNDRVLKKTINAIPRKNVKNNFLEELFAPPQFSYVIDEEKNICLLTIKSLSNKKNFQQMADKMFVELKNKNIENLVIDLRHNGGGDSSIGDILVSYLIDTPFNQFCKAEIKISETAKSMGIELPDSTGVIIADTSNFIVFVDPKPVQQRFIGNVYVLTSHMTFSSASALASLLKESGIAKTVGEETGGMSISYGNIIKQQLPISGITLVVSFARLHLTGSDENNIHGVLPDFPVDSVDALDKVFKLITNQ